MLSSYPRLLEISSDKLQLIDRAIRLASNDTSTEYANYVRENSEEIFEPMASGNYKRRGRYYLSASRYSWKKQELTVPTSTAHICQQYLGERHKAWHLFVERMSYIYGDGIWSSKLFPKGSVRVAKGTSGPTGRGAGQSITPTPISTDLSTMMMSSCIWVASAWR